MNLENMVLRLVIAVACGAALGFEREIRDKAAGLRTHILVCLGSCLFGMLGIEVTARYPQADILRLAQGILIGIGFLGAGVIAREGVSIRGLTTAAGIWVMGAIGMAIGIGSYYIALLGTLFALLTMSMFAKIEGWVKK